MGWTREHLEKKVIRLQGGGESSISSPVHASFHLERTYEASVARVWSALTDQSAKQKWFGGPRGWELVERHMDVRVGGTERLKGRWENGIMCLYSSIYHDVVPNERLVYSYVVQLGEKNISVSLATMLLRSEGGKTTLMLAEHGAFLDGSEDAGLRERRMSDLLDVLGSSLREAH